MRFSATSFNAVLLCRFTASAYVLRLFAATRSTRTVLPLLRHLFFRLHVSTQCHEQHQQWKQSVFDVSVNL